MTYCQLKGKMKTLKQLAQESIAVQNASNLLGVINGFSKVIENLRDLGLSPREHPITKVWVDKINSLTQMQAASFTEINKAYDEVEAIIKE